MALYATFKDAGQTIKNSYIKIDRIWGSKEEGWNAWVGVYKKITDKLPETKFHISANYSETEMNPFKILYDAIKVLPFLDNVEDHDSHKSVIITSYDADEDELVEKVSTPVMKEKKSRSKKKA